VSGQQKTTWFSTSHARPPRLIALSLDLIVVAPNFLQNLWPGTVGIVEGNLIVLHETDGIFSQTTDTECSMIVMTR
jgi:hypothetical protein